jgi:hypothetical protein
MPAPRVLINDLPDQPTTVSTDLLVVQNGTTTKKLAVGTLTSHSDQAVADHVADLTAAHAAGSISAVANMAPMTGVDVQTQLGQAASALASAMVLIQNLRTDLTALSERIPGRRRDT